MGYDYYDFRKAKVNICHALSAKGWKIFGYKEDQSDSMTDYYSPAAWNGIAEKNGFVFVCDCSDYDVKSYSGKEIYRYTKPFQPGQNYADKIQKLQAIADDPAATEGERAASLAGIERLTQEIQNHRDERERTRELEVKYPEFMANPNRAKWHIEKSGKILEKGTGIGKYSEIPYYWDVVANCVSSHYTYGRDNWKPSEEEQKVIKQFNAFIAKIDETATRVMVSDGNPDTEQEALKAEARRGYEQVTVTETKTVIQPFIIDPPTEYNEGAVYFRMERNYTNGADQGNIYKLTRLGENRLVFNRMNGKLDKVCTGLANPGNYFHTSRETLELIHSKGHISFVELREVAEHREVEKWVKIDRTTSPTAKPQKQATSVKEENPATSVTPEPVISGTINIGDDEQATPRQLWALHCATKLNTKELKISKGAASKLIDRSKKGENITEEVTRLLSNPKSQKGGLT